MTIINPMRPFGTSAVIVQSDINPAWTYVGAAGHYKTAQIHAALGVTANAEVAGLRRDLRVAEAAADEWKARAEKAEAAVERVLEAAEALDLEFGTAGDIYATRRIRAAIDPPPAFTLPTEVPARIEAKRDGKTYTFYLWTNGAGGSNDLIWVDEDDWTHSPSPERLLERFTDHRVVES